MVWANRKGGGVKAEATLVCIPHAGGGVSAYRRWAEALGPRIVVKPVQLRGRESRFREPPLTELRDVVADLYDLVLADTAQPFALFGHSMGALLAFELAHMLREKSGRTPLHLFVSSCRAPELRQVTNPFSDLPQAEFVAELNRRYGGIPAAILADQDYMAAVLPALRADFGIIERYQLEPRPPLACPLTVFGGRHDEVISQAAMTGWRRHTTGLFNLEMLGGDHLYLQAQQIAMAKLISSALSPRLNALGRDISVAGR